MFLKYTYDIPVLGVWIKEHERTGIWPLRSYHYKSAFQINVYLMHKEILIHERSNINWTVVTIQKVEGFIANTTSLWVIFIGIRIICVWHKIKFFPHISLFIGEIVQYLKWMFLFFFSLEQGFEDCIVLDEILDKYNNDFCKLLCHYFC